jgi:hypothetical protein
METKRNTRNMKNRPHKLLKTLLLAPLLLALTGCVTYYYPAVDTSDGVYYAAEDPAYAGNSSDYVSVRYYPWWSVDYFYLGSGYSGSGFSFGLSYGYPTYPWAYYPRRWYYDPWYYSYWYAPVHYHYSWFGYAYHKPYWHVRYRGQYGGYRRGDDHRYGGGRYDRDRYAGGGGDYRRGNDPGPDSNPPRDYDRGRSLPDGGSYAGTGAGTRRVSVAPGGASSDRGMVVVSRDGGKWSRSRLEPIKRPNRATANSDRDSYRGRERPGGGSAERYADADRGTGVVAYPAEARRRISRVAPVTPSEARGSAADNTQQRPAPPPSRVVRLPDRDTQARAAAAARSSAVRLQPAPAGARSAAQSAPPARSAPPPRSSGPRMDPPRSVRNASVRSSRSAKAASDSRRRASSKDDR